MTRTTPRSASTECTQQLGRCRSRLDVACASACHDRKRCLPATVRRGEISAVVRQEVHNLVEAFVDHVMERRVAVGIDGIDVRTQVHCQPYRRLGAVLVVLLGLKSRRLGQRSITLSLSKPCAM